MLTIFSVFCLLKIQVNCKMAYNIPDNFDESAFVEDVGRHCELYDISHNLYSNNEHHRSIFHQIGAVHRIDGIWIIFYFQVTRINFHNLKEDGIDKWSARVLSAIDNISLLYFSEEAAAKEWKSILDKYVRLSKCMNQSCSGAPGIDVLSQEENEFIQRLDFLRGHINRRKR